MSTTYAVLDFYHDLEGKYRWRLTMPGQGDPRHVLAVSSQGYSSRSNARRAYRRVEALITAGQVRES